MALYTVNFSKYIESSKEEIKTLALLKPGVSNFKIRQIDISMDSSGAATGVKIEICRVVINVEGKVETSVANKTDERDGTANTTVHVYKNTASENPTYTEAPIIASYYVQPLGGLLPLPFPYGSEIIGAASGKAIAILSIAEANTYANVTGQIWFEE